MTEHRGSPPEERKVERAIVVRLLPSHYERRSSLQAALKHIEPSVLEDALERLQQHGVVEALTTDAIRVSPCAQPRRPGAGGHMTTSTQPSELGPYKPVSDALILAAIDRAQRHSSHECDYGVLWGILVEHLGFAHSPATTRKLRPQVSRLKAAGLVERRKAGGYTVWRLTSDGREQLAKARRKREDLTLPEAPQHREWRKARAAAVERIDRIRERLRDTLRDADKLLDTAQGGDSDSWFALSRRLSRRSDRLASATYCLREWPEPDDAHADRDDSSENNDGRRSFHWKSDPDEPGASCDQTD